MTRAGTRAGLEVASLGGRSPASSGRLWASLLTSLDGNRESGIGKGREEGRLEGVGPVDENRCSTASEGPFPHVSCNRR